MGRGIYKVQSGLYIDPWDKVCLQQEINSSVYIKSQRDIVMMYVCNTKTYANTIINKSNTNIDIEDFINKLLSSQKFDELAEKVADKAAKKIKDNDKPVIRFERFNANNNHSLQDSFTESSKKEYEKETTVIDTNLKKEGPLLSKLEKINTDAIMKKEASKQSENLRLKYKYLTRSAQKSDVRKSTVLVNFDEDVESPKERNVPEIKKQQQQPENNTEGHSSNQDAIEKKKPNLNIMEHSREDDPKRVEEKSVLEKESEVQNDKHESKKVENTKISDLKDKEHETEEAAKSNSSTEEDIKQLESLEKQELSPEKTKEEEDLKESIEESEKSEMSEEAGDDNDAPMFRADDNEDPDVENNKVSLDYQGNPEISQEVTTSTKKLLVRKEGNKIYAFADGTDYEEYHEQYAKIQKEKVNIPVFPIL